MSETDHQPDPDPIKEALWLIVDREYDIPTNEAMKALDQLRGRVAELEGWISQDGLSVLIAERDRYREALKQIVRWQEGAVGTMRQDDTTINHAKAALNR